MANLAGGLGSAEARRLLLQHGPNELPRVRQRSGFAMLAAQFMGLVPLLLLAAALISLLRRDVPEAMAVLAVLALNAVIGFVVELRSRSALEALRATIVTRARVLRDGAVRQIDARTVVPGDILVLDAGDGVAADAKLIQASELAAVESALTGESLPVTKDADYSAASGAPLAERKNTVFAGTTIVRGLAHAEVIATGAHTQIGRIGALTSAIRPVKSPLERSIDALGRWLIFATAAAVMALAAVNLARGIPLHEILTLAIALAVAVIPEGLPAVVTVTLALGVQRMARARALMRRMHAVEALGSTTVVCTDKTGTLTTGRLTLTHAFLFLQQRTLSAETAEWIQAADLVSAARLAKTDAASAEPIDAAIDAAAHALKLDPAWAPPDVAIPFTSARQFSASFRQKGSIRAYLKGAPHIIINMCDDVDGTAAAAVLAANNAMAAAGMRVLGIATGEVRAPTEAALRHLTFIGLLGFRDPPAAGVKEAVQQLRRAGITTVMLTGDQQLTGEAIAREVGNIDQVFSRVDPEQKLRIVQNYQRAGEVVAVFGDGVNDAAALRQANVGVAMGGRGTDVAKEAAAVVLQDDSFATIVAAVREGRVIFDNIAKFAFYLFSCNAAELMVLLGATAAGLPQPLLPLQILWLNLVTDTLPALALAAEPGGDDIMRRPPRRPGSALLSRTLTKRIFGFALLIAAGTIGAFTITLRLAGYAAAMTTAFLVLGFAQILHLGNARSEAHVLSSAAVRSNRPALLAVVVSALLLLTATYAPALPGMLGIVPPTITAWTVIAVFATLPAVVGQALAIKRTSRLLRPQN